MKTFAGCALMLIAALFAQGAVAAGDLFGVWSPRGQTITFSATDPQFKQADDMPMQPWALEKFRNTKSGYGPHATPESEDPTFQCYPPGMPLILLIPFPLEIIEARDRIVMYFEYSNLLRQIFMDGRPHPADLQPTYMGHSTGRWEGDTLVVDTVGLTDKSWLDRAGHPHSDALHIVERMRRLDHETLEIDLTFDDAKAYTRPWKGRKLYTFRPGWEIMEYVCADNFRKPAAAK